MANQVTVTSNNTVQVNVATTPNTQVTISRAVIGTVANVVSANYANFAGNAFAVDGSNVNGPVASAVQATTAGTVTTNAQPNITSVGTLTNLAISGDITTVDSITLDTAASEAYAVAKMYWNTVDGTMNLGMYNNVTQQVGQEIFFYGKAQGNITNGQVVMFAGVQGDHFLIKTADASSVGFKKEYIMGIATQNINNGDFGYVTWFGKINDINTNGYSAGAILWFDPTVAGGLTQTEPTGTQVKVLMAAVVKAQTSPSAENGIYFVRVTFEPNLNDIQGVKVTSPTQGQVLSYDAANSVWINSAVTAVANANYANVAGTAYSVSLANVSGAGNIASINLTGSSSNVLYGNGTFGPVVTTLVGDGGNLSNIQGANVVGAVGLSTYATSANSVAGANVTGTVANATYATSAGSADSATTAGTVTTNAQPNITSLGNLSGLTVNGTTTTTDLVVNGNLQIGNLVANSANYANFAGVAYSVNGSNVSGEVANAAYATTAGSATIAASANSVAGANVTGTVANATYATSAGSATVAASANSVAGANVTGTVANATFATSAGTANSATVAASANSVAGANVTGTVANATYATTAGSANTANSATVAASANSVAVANVSGIGNIATVNLNGNASSLLNGTGNWIAIPSTANANYANFAGNVTVASQPNITSLGTLTSLLVGNATSNIYLDSSIMFMQGNARLAINNGNITSGLPLALAQSFNNASHSFTMLNLELTDRASLANSKFVDFENNNVSQFNVGKTGNINFAGVITGNGSGLSAIAGANVTGTVSTATTAGTVTTNAQPNITSVGTLANLTSSGNIRGANVIANTGGAFYGAATGLSGIPGANVTGTVANATYAVSAGSATTAGTANSVAGANVTGTVANATYATSAGSATVAASANSVAGANVTGTVANAAYATTAGSANSVAVANVSGIGNIATINLDGNVSNALLGNGTWGPVESANANYANFAGTAYSVAGANVTGTVANATYATSAGSATTAGTANSVAGANVSGEVANAAYANISGTAYSVSGANVSGEVANAAYANLADESNYSYGVDVANVVGIGNIATINLDSNVANALLGDGTWGPLVSANANYANFAGTAYSVDGANVVGEVANAAYANISGIAYSVDLANVSGIGNIANINLDGDASNVLYGNGVWAPAGSGGTPNFANFAGNVYSTGDVYLETYSGNSDGGIINANATYLYLGGTTATPLTYSGIYAVDGCDEFSTGTWNNTAINLRDSDARILFNAGPGDTLTLVPNLATFDANVQIGSIVAPNTILYTDGNIVSNNIIQANSFVGEGGNLSNITAGNITGTVANATYATTAGSADSVAGANVTGTVANANIGNNVTILQDFGNANAQYITYVGANTSGNQKVKVDLSLSYIPNTNILSTSATGGFNGRLVGANTATPNSFVSVAGASGNIIANVSGTTRLTISANGANVNGNISGTQLAVSGNANISNLNLVKFGETVITGGNTGAATLTPDAAAGTIYKYTLTGNITLSALSNAVAGTSMTVILTQDATGNRLLTSTMKFAGGIKTLSTAANSIDIMSVFYDGSTYFASLTKGYA